jgi:hypothetical protein
VQQRVTTNHSSKVVIIDISFYQCAVSQFHVEENSLTTDIANTLDQVYADSHTNVGSLSHWVKHLNDGNMNSKSNLQWSTMNCQQKVDAVIKHG